MKYFRKLMILAMVLAIAMTCLIPAVFADGTDGTITLNNAAIGKEYQAYKILDATYSGNNIAYTTKSLNLFSGEGSPWAVQTVPDASGNYSVTLAAGKTMADVNTWIGANLSYFTAIAPSTGVATDGKAAADTLVWSNLGYGYYYITSGLGAVVTVDSVKPTATVIDKNITNPANLTKASDSATAQIGDVVQFTVTFTATNYITDNTTDAGVVTAETEQVTSYTITDTADGFDYLIDANHPVTVQVGNRTATSVTVTPAQQDASKAGSMTFTVDWDDENGEPLYQFSENVTITYYGVVNEFADDGTATNNVSISNSTGKDTLTDSTTTNTYNLTINKVDANNAPLTGAKFELYRKANTDTLVTLIDITSTVENASAATRYYRVAESGETGVTTIDLTEGTSSAVIYGLDGTDTYSILETEAPKGYNKLSAATEHAMNNANGTETIQNVAGVVLPSTGGMGTTLFYILGGLMVAGALVILVTNKRMRRQ